MMRVQYTHPNIYVLHMMASNGFADPSATEKAKEICTPTPKIPFRINTSFQPVQSIKDNTYKYLLIYLHNFKIHKNSGITNEEQES